MTTLLFAFLSGASAWAALIAYAFNRGNWRQHALGAVMCLVIAYITPRLSGRYSGPLEPSVGHHD